MMTGTKSNFVRGKKMRTIITSYKRRRPTVTARFLETINGPGTAHVSESTPNRAMQPVSSTGYVETSKDIMIRAAEHGYDIYYKTASGYGAARYYVYLGSEHADCTLRELGIELH